MRFYQIPDRVVRWYDRKSRNWITQTLDRAGNQIGEADYDGTKADALLSEKARKRELMRADAMRPITDALEQLDDLDGSCEMEAERLRTRDGALHHEYKKAAREHRAKAKILRDALPIVEEFLKSCEPMGPTP